MVFNGETNDQDICTLADKKAGSNDVSFPLKEKALYASMKAREVWRVIWGAYGGWNVDDNANTGEPEATVALSTTLRNVYAFATAQAIIAMEWLDSSGNWNPLTPITIEEINARGMAETEFENTPGDPVYYRPVQNGVRIYPDSSAARSDALKAKILRDIVAFTPSDTTKTPGWDANLHEGLAIGMAHEYAKNNTLAVSASLANDWALFLSDVAAHYQRKFRQNFPPKLKKKSDVVGAYV